MKATSLALAVLFACSSAVSAATPPSLFSKMTAGLNDAAAAIKSKTNSAVTAVGLNRVDIGFKFTCPKPLGSYLTPLNCPPTLNAPDVLFSTAYDPWAQSDLYCPAALTSLAAMDVVDTLVKAADSAPESVNNALLSLMYKYVRLNGNYKPRRIQVKFNECMTALKSLSITCTSAECSLDDLSTLKTTTMDAVKDICFSIPTMKTQLLNFFGQLEKAIPASQTSGTVQTLKTPAGIASAFNKAASSSSFIVNPLLTDGSIIAARERIVLILKKFNKIRPDWYTPAKQQFQTDNGAAIEFDGQGKPSMTISSIQLKDFAKAEEQLLGGQVTVDSNTAASN
jgi:hypothetical protein